MAPSSPSPWLPSNELKDRPLATIVNDLKSKDSLVPNLLNGTLKKVA
jgi:hypothetical protein